MDGYRICEQMGIDPGARYTFRFTKAAILSKNLQARGSRTQTRSHALRRRRLHYRMAVSIKLINTLPTTKNGAFIKL